MEIKEYITSILYISIFAIILELFLPKTKLKKYISSIVSLLILIAIISPVFNLFSNDNIERAVDSAIYALSNNNSTSLNSTSFDFNEYKNKVIVSRVKTNLEQEMLQEFSKSLKDITKLQKVEVMLNDDYQINEVTVYIDGGNLNTVKIILDRIIAEYNVPSSMLKVINKGA